MTNIKKFNLFICSLLMLLTSLFFVACGNENYSNVSLSVSQSSVELQVDESVELKFTINNMLKEMSNELKLEFMPSGKASAEVISAEENIVTVRVTGVEAGTTTLIAKTKDGLKSCNVNLFITKYSSSLQPNDNMLYLSSNNNNLVIKNSDFLFDDETNEKNLKFYFYGYNADNEKLELNDVSSVTPENGRTFYNNFVSVKIVKNNNYQNYLIFTDENGNEFTLSPEKHDLNYNNNKKYDLISIEKDDEGNYIFDNATRVSVGQEFTFIAYYENPNSNEEIFAQKDFIVLADLDKAEVEMNYGYAIFTTENSNIELSEEIYFEENFNKNKITLVPEYTKNWDANSYIDFKNAIITISTPFDNESLQYTVESSAPNASSYTYQAVKVEGGTSYIINLSTKSTQVQDFELTFKLYYKGFENSKDENVAINVKIPVSIKSKPNQILLSSDSFSNIMVNSRTFVFYNHYVSDTTGWQRFYFSVLPIGSNFNELQIKMPQDCGLQIRYNKTVYTAGQTVVVDDLNNYVEIKGIDDATVADNLSLQIEVLYNILTDNKEDSEKITSQFNYKILQGSTSINFENQDFKNKISISINENNDVVDFSNQIYTDAYFDDFTVALQTGDRANVEFVKSSQVCKQIGDKYYLQFGLLPKSIGESSYSITLPNGSAITLTVNVIETLQYPNLSTTNKNANIEIVDFNQDNATIYARYNSENVNANNSFDLSVFSNNTTNANAITSFELSLNVNSNLSILNKNETTVNFLMGDTGVAQITFTINGYQVNNFVVSQIQLTYQVKVVVYELIKELTINKLKDGQIDEYPENTSARYVYVYDQNANSISKKQAYLDISISQFDNNTSPYLFVNPATGNFEESKFDKKFVYWTLPSGYSAKLQGANVPDGKMYIQSNQDSSYQIYRNYLHIATFDAESLILTLEKDATADFMLIANIEQFNVGVRSFSVNVRILKYDAVESLSSLSPTSELYFSTMETSHEFNLRVLQNSAINKAVKVSLEGGSYVSDGTTYNIFGDVNSDNSGIMVNVSGSIVNVLLTVNKDFLNNSDKIIDEFNAKLTIAAQDWYDDTGLLLEEYTGKVLTINIKFGNGNEKNPFYIDSVDDVEKIANNLNAYYKLVSTVDVSTLVERNVLPFGKFNGTIVGTKDYSVITGLNFKSCKEVTFKENANDSDETATYTSLLTTGLFAKLGENAVIKNISFEGSFDITLGTNESGIDRDLYIGLIAGQNEGTIENVSVTLSKSNIEIIGTQISYGDNTAKYNAYIGGLVGYNKGIITQDFTETTSNEFKLYNYMLFMNDFTTIDYKYINVYAGGITGKSEGLIQKIDSEKVVYGYSNYLAYSLIKTNLIPENSQTGGDVPSQGVETDAVSVDYIGAVAGQIVANEENKGLISKKSNANYTISDYQQGKGIIVGGEIQGMSYVGGVVGQADIGKNNSFLGITTRTFVRGLSSKTNIGLISGNIIVGDNISIEPIFYIQAIDDKKTGESSAMIILYINKIVQEGQEVAAVPSLDNLNNIAFGLQGTELDSLETIHFINYVTRTQKSLEDNIEPLDPTVYYGNAVIIDLGENSNKTIKEQLYFKTQGEDKEFKIEGNIKNSNGDIINSLTNSSNDTAFFAYYFDAKELVGLENNSGILDVQKLLDDNYNTLEANDTLYPFATSSDLSLTSLNTDILRINQSGKISISGTGWARISGSSILNVNKGINFYIFVTNYFNPDENVSIVYRSLSENSNPVDETKISMFAKDTEILYIRPNYLYSEKQNDEEGNNSSLLNVDKNGLAVIGNYQFNLAQNTNITANISIFESGTDKEAKNEFTTSVAGQIINITKEQTTTSNQNFDLKIYTKLESNYNGQTYFVPVNKQLGEIKINYSKGAEAIGLSTYDNLTISTNNQASETIILRSSASKEDEGILYEIYFDDKIVQSNDMSGLFYIPAINCISSGSSTDLIKNYQYSLKISVDKNSAQYQNRFNENIYGQYRIVLKAKSNPSIYTTMYLTLENMPLQSVVIDNYNNFVDMKENIGLSSDFAYPGNASLLAITLSPEDSDFDYIIIENAEANSQSGNGYARFELAARNIDNSSTQSDENTDETQSQKSLFTSGVISGSATSNGLMITKDEIEQVYNGSDYKDYSGIIYFKYDIGNSGVVENSRSSFVVKIYNDNKVIKTSTIDLTLKLKESVSLSIEGKKKEEGLIPDTYRVARGLRYKLNIQSYGFNSDSIQLYLTDDNNFVTLENVNGEYYIQIDDKNVSSQTKASIKVVATRVDGDNEITAKNSIDLIIMNYVVNPDLNNSKDLDVITNMVDGVITMPIGSSKTVKVDIYDYIEYDNSNQLVVNMVDSFVNSLNNNGSWSYFSNIKNGESIPSVGAGEADTEYKLYPNVEESNYYFKYNNFAFVPLRINNPDANLYYLYYKVNYTATETGYQISQNANDMGFSTTIRFDVYVASSDKSPIPIFNYDDFLDMKVDGHYILLNDIILPSKEYVDAFDDAEQQYMPLNGNFASLDGNGHSIVLDGTYDFGSLGQLGIFTELSSDSVIKNLNVKLLSSFDTGSSDYGVIFKTTSANNSIGLLVADNSGIITNCKVTAPTNKFFTVESPVGGVDAAYFGGIAGQNFGYITNCNTSIYAYGSFNLAGIVGVNSGKIASSYFKGGILESSGNQLGEGYHVGGLVYRNLENGQIITSYTSSGISNSSVYSKNKDSYLSSANYSAGFVYYNAGLVQDCYSDMYFGKGESGSNMAGFAYINAGTIKNSFSLSVLQSGNNASAGFSMYNYNFEESGDASTTKGVFENCYYLSHNHIDLGENACKGCGFDESINVSLNPVVFEGVAAIDDFDNMEHFESYAYSGVVGTNAVWFYSSNGDVNGNYVEFIATNDSVLVDNDNGIGQQYNVIYDVGYKTLPKGRLELASPNIDALSVRNFVSSENDATTGNITYIYQDDISSSATSFATRGTIYNPYLIYNAETMESLIIENNVPITNQNSANYRLISDVNYSSYIYNSQIYNTVYIGNFEGNGMEISSIVLQSNSKLENAGLFAELGISSSKSGVIKNLTLSPSSVLFSNATTVGGVVGNVNNGQLYNITVSSDEDLIVVGSNFVGGVVGKANGQYSFKNIYSNVGAVANYSPTTDQVYKEGGNTSVASYAGGLFGYLGAGSAQNLEVENIKTVRGDRTGLAIGGIGANGNASNIEVSSLSTTRIKVYRYGGIAIGEVVGKVSQVVVYNNGIDSQTIFSIDQIPLAVGGIAGLVAGGTIENAVMQQSFKVEAKKIGISSIYSTVENVGGIAGLIGNAGSSISNISKCIVSGAITSSSRLGGAVGSIASATMLDQIAVKSDMKVEGQREFAILGGIIGNIESTPTPQVYLTNSYCHGDLTINTSNALNKPKAEIGGLVAVYSSNLTMENCYTKATLNVSLKDLNSIDSMTSFRGLEFAGEESEGDAVKFYKQYGNDNNKITDCYYYGATGNASVNTVDLFIDVYSNFNIATNGESEYLTINNYGQSSYESSTYYIKDDMKNSIVFGECCFENISLPLDSEKIKTIDGQDVGKYDIAVGRVQRETSVIIFIKEITKTTDAEGNSLNYIEILEEDLNSLTEQETTISLYLYKNTPLWNGYNIANINTEFRTLTFENNLYWVKK